MEQLARFIGMPSRRTALAGSDMVSQFERAITSRKHQKAQASKPLGLEDTLPSQARYALQTLDFTLKYEAESENMRRIIKAVDKGYIKISPRLMLLPLNGLDELIHYGAIKYESSETSFDNLRNLQRFGVFGNPDKHSTTYLQLPGSDMAQNSSDWCGKEFPYRIEIELDAKVIEKIKPIYLDPETILPNPMCDTLVNFGQSYFILGGIPKEAIKSYRFPYYFPRAQGFTQW
jgi:hypothetical protein